MFRTILAEFKYFKSFFFIFFAFTFFLFMQTIIKGSNVYGFIISTSILFLISTAIFGIASLGEKRDRFLALLPLSVKTTGKQNLLFMILYKVSFFILWIIIYFTRYLQQDPGLIWTMISMAMFNLIFIFLIMIGGELSFYYGKKPRISIFVISIFTSSILFSAIISNIETYQYSEFIEIPLFEAFMELFKLPVGSLFMSIAAGIFFYLAYIVMINRRTNLN